MKKTLFSASEDPLDILEPATPEVKLSFSQLMSHLKLMLEVRDYLWQQLEPELPKHLAQELHLKYALSVEGLICPNLKINSQGKIEKIIINYYFAGYSVILRHVFTQLVAQLKEQRNFQVLQAVEFSVKYEPQLLQSVQEYDLQLQKQSRTQVTNYLHDTQVRQQIYAQQVRQLLGISEQEFARLVGYQGNLEQVHKLLRERERALQANVLDVDDPELNAQIHAYVENQLETRLTYLKAQQLSEQQSQATYQEVKPATLPSFVNEEQLRSQIFWETLSQALQEGPVAQIAEAVRAKYKQQTKAQVVIPSSPSLEALQEQKVDFTQELEQQQKLRQQRELEILVSANLEVMTRKLRQSFHQQGKQLLKILFTKLDFKYWQGFYQQYANKYYQAQEILKSNPENSLAQEILTVFKQPVSKKLLGDFVDFTFSHSASWQIGEHKLDFQLDQKEFLEQAFRDPLNLIELYQTLAVDNSLEQIIWEDEAVISKVLAGIDWFTFAGNYFQEQVEPLFNKELVLQFNLTDLTVYNEKVQQLQAQELAIPAPLTQSQQIAQLDKIQAQIKQLRSQQGQELALQQALESPKWQAYKEQLQAFGSRTLTSSLEANALEKEEEAFGKSTKTELPKEPLKLEGFKESQKLQEPKKLQEAKKLAESSALKAKTTPSLASTQAANSQFASPADWDLLLNNLQHNLQLQEKAEQERLEQNLARKLEQEEQNLALSKAKQEQGEFSKEQEYLQYKQEQQVQELTSKLKNLQQEVVKVLPKQQPNAEQKALIQASREQELQQQQVRQWEQAQQQETIWQQLAQQVPLYAQSPEAYEFIVQFTQALAKELFRSLTFSVNNRKLPAELLSQLSKEKNAYELALARGYNPGYHLLRLQNKFFSRQEKKGRKLANYLVYSSDFIGKVPNEFFLHEEKAPYVGKMGMTLALKHEINQQQRGAKGSDEQESLEFAYKGESELDTLDPSLPLEQAITKLVDQRYERKDQEFIRQLYHKYIHWYQQREASLHQEQIAHYLFEQARELLGKKEQKQALKLKELITKRTKNNLELIVPIFEQTYVQEQVSMRTQLYKDFDLIQALVELSQAGISVEKLMKVSAQLNQEEHPIFAGLIDLVADYQELLGFKLIKITHADQTLPLTESELRERAKTSKKYQEILDDPQKFASWLAQKQQQEALQEKQFAQMLKKVQQLQLEQQQAEQELLKQQVIEVKQSKAKESTQDLHLRAWVGTKVSTSGQQLIKKAGWKQNNSFKVAPEVNQVIKQLQRQLHEQKQVEEIDFTQFIDHEELDLINVYQKMVLNPQLAALESLAQEANLSSFCAFSEAPFEPLSYTSQELAQLQAEYTWKLAQEENSNLEPELTMQGLEIQDEGGLNAFALQPKSQEFYSLFEYKQQKAQVSWLHAKDPWQPKIESEDLEPVPIDNLTHAPHYQSLQQEQQEHLQALLQKKVDSIFTASNEQELAQKLALIKQRNAERRARGQQEISFAAQEQVSLEEQAQEFEAKRKALKNLED
ncbi:hypothetical protein [Psittacicella gerlachiana]|uniref:Uncharacterized protein n=1 Tax=Psittacicella gerlachiana TaxID=2028574 RepID=A0A3A1YR96_9GAMM|nr:hypothetical protein [Psittacicella gerlachiana]RIY38567.1 hypothetical protein CKF59_00580 [Psittacicella gerlachiana]